MEALSQSKDAAEKQSRGQEAIDWSQFTPVKPEGAFEKYLRDQEKLESAQTAASSGASFLGAVVNVGLALAVGYGLFRLISPRSVSTAVHVGQKWLAWTAMVWSAVQLPPFFRKLDINSFALWLLGFVVLGTIAFLSGWAYARFVVPRRLSRSGPTADKNISTSVIPENSVAERLRSLDDLRRKGLVSQGEYDEQRQRILHDL